MKPKTVRPKIQPQLDQREMKQLMEKDPEDEEDEAGRTEADRIKGVGFSRCSSRSSNNNDISSNHSSWWQSMQAERGG